MDRSKKSAGSAIECESTVLPWRLLTQSRQALDESPDRSGIALVLFGKIVCLASGLRRQFELPGNSVDNLFARVAKLCCRRSSYHRPVG